MDQYSLAELTELYFSATTSMDAQFQFWLSVTFAVVIAGFIAGDRLTKKLSYLAAILYGLATFVLIARFIDAARFGGMLRDSILEAGVEIPTVNLAVIVARFSLLILGTLAALYFLLRERVNEGETGETLRE